MKKFTAAAISTLAIVSAAGCGKIPTAHPAASSAVQSVAVQGDQVIADTAQGGDKSLEITFGSKDAAFTSQSIVHRWVSQDVVEFDVTLSANGQGIVTVPVMMKDGQTSAIFDHLKLGTQYTVTVVARGNDGGDPTQPLQVINSQTPATGTILFQGNQDVDNSQSLTINVQLDNVVFDGNASVSVKTTDGSYLEYAGESGAAQ